VTRNEQVTRFGVVSMTFWQGSRRIAGKWSPSKILARSVSGHIEAQMLLVNQVQGIVTPGERIRKVLYCESYHMGSRLET